MGDIHWNLEARVSAGHLKFELEGIAVPKSQESYYSMVGEVRRAAQSVSEVMKGYFRDLRIDYEETTTSHKNHLEGHQVIRSYNPTNIDPSLVRRFLSKLRIFKRLPDVFGFPTFSHPGTKDAKFKADYFPRKLTINVAVAGYVLHPERATLTEKVLRSISDSFTHVRGVGPYALLENLLFELPIDSSVYSTFVEVRKKLGLIDKLEYKEQMAAVKVLFPGKQPNEEKLYDARSRAFGVVFKNIFDRLSGDFMFEGLMTRYERKEEYEKALALKNYSEAREAATSDSK
jgi:hypothetical protein